MYIHIYIYVLYIYIYTCIYARTHDLGVTRNLYASPRCRKRRPSSARRPKLPLPLSLGTCPTPDTRDLIPDLIPESRPDTRNLEPVHKTKRNAVPETLLSLRRRCFED